MTESISWFATGATVTAALITASNLGARITGYGFVVFLLGSLAWLSVGLMTGQPALLWTNAILTLLNIFGIWRWLGRQSRIEDGADAAQAASERTPGETLFPASLLGRAALMDARGKEIARSVDAMIGSSTGRIHYLTVSVGGVAGVGETLHRVDWHQARVDGDTIGVALQAHELNQLPALPRDRWPAQ